MSSTAKMTRKAARAVESQSIGCAACGGTGAELTCGRGPEGWRRVGIQPCFWCGGRGHFESDCAPEVCAACGRIGVVVDGERVCSDCTHYESAADPRFHAEPILDGDDGAEYGEFGY